MKTKLLKLFNYNDWSIKVKLLSMTIPLVISSVLVVSFLSYNKYTQDFHQQSSKSIQQTIVQLSYNIQTYLDELYQLSEAPYHNSQLMSILEQSEPDSDLDKLEKTMSIEKLLDNMMITPRKDILSAYLLSDTIYRGSNYSSSIDYEVDYKQYYWYNKAISTNNAIFVPTHMEQLISNPKFKVFSIVRRINSIKKNKKLLAVIKIDAEYSILHSICSKIESSNNGGLFIIDENNTIVYSDRESKDYEGLFNSIKSSTNTIMNTNYEGEEYLINSTLIPRANWTIITLNSIKELNKNALHTRNMTFVMAIACSIVAIIILLAFINSFLRPLFEIIKSMNEIEKGNFQVEFPLIRNDEIGYLGSSFNSMVIQIKNMMDKNVTLIREVYEAKLLQSEAQMSTLYNQIRPHFINNTLNMISLLIRSGKYETALDNIDNLSDLMRFITKLDKEIPLEEEINLLTAYLSIQRSRYNGRLDYSINIANDFYSYLIPALTLQPVVENSVIHGCERRKEKTFIRIYSVIENEKLIIFVEDNANGMDRETLEQLREKVYNCKYYNNSKNTELPTKGNGIGLVNVNKRIKLRFGIKYGLIIDSVSGKGTCVKIELPITLTEEITSLV